MKNSGLFLNMAKWCFLGLFFEVLMLLWFVFWCVWHSSRSVKNACFFFPVFFGLLWGGLFLFILGLEGLGVLVFLVFVFVFLCCFCFCFVCFGFCCVVGLLLVLVLVLLLFLFVCFFFYFCSCFWFLLFFVCFCFFLLFSWEGLRVRWGGPKGHLTWP